MGRARVRCYSEAKLRTHLLRLLPAHRSPYEPGVWRPRAHVPSRERLPIGLGVTKRPSSCRNIQRDTDFLRRSGSHALELQLNLHYPLVELLYYYFYIVTALS